MGVKEWRRDSGEIEWNEEVYDPKAKKWLREPPPGRESEPSSYEAYRAFKEMLEVGHDLKAGMVTVTVGHYSPETARQWVGVLVEAVNEYFQLRDMTKARKSISYEQKIHETSIAEMQAVFYGMIEAWTKTLMLAEVDERYFLVNVLEPKLAEVKPGPARALIWLLFVLVGVFFSVVFVLILGPFSVSRSALNG